MSCDLQGGYDGGAPDKVPDLIRFSPTVTPASAPHSEAVPAPQREGAGGRGEGAGLSHRNRTESTESFNMEPQVCVRACVRACVCMCVCYMYTRV